MQIGIVSILMFFFLSKYRVLAVSGLQEFKTWYPNFGIAIFIIKTILVSLITAIIIYYLFKFFLYKKHLKVIQLVHSISKTLHHQNKFKKHYIFFSIILISMIVREFYPFSLYPMYNNFPNWSYTFYFTDENDQSLSYCLKDRHENISHIYFAEFYNKGWKVGEGHENEKHLNIVGKNIIEKSIDFKRIKESGINEIRLKRINNHFIGDELKIDTSRIYTYYLNEN